MLLFRMAKYDPSQQPAEFVKRLLEHPLDRLSQDIYFNKYGTAGISKDESTTHSLTPTSTYQDLERYLAREERGFILHDLHNEAKEAGDDRRAKLFDLLANVPTPVDDESMSYIDDPDTKAALRKKYEKIEEEIQSRSTIPKLFETLRKMADKRPVSKDDKKSIVDAMEVISEIVELNTMEGEPLSGLDDVRGIETTDDVLTKAQEEIELSEDLYQIDMGMRRMKDYPEARKRLESNFKQHQQAKAMLGQQVDGFADALFAVLFVVSDRGQSIG